MRLIPCALVIAAGLAAAAWSVPAAAQTLDELTVTARNLRANPQTLSEVVSYADLDLTLTTDRRTLDRRVDTVAARVCDLLNEPRRDHTNLGHSCQDVAVRGAQDQVRLAVADARGSDRFASVRPAGGYATQASATVASREGMAPIPDTRANRARFGDPQSAAGRRTAANGH